MFFGPLDVNQFSAVLVRRAGFGASELSGMAAGDQSSSGGNVYWRQQHAAPTHSQSTRMNGAPSAIIWATPPQNAN